MSNIYDTLMSPLENKWLSDHRKRIMPHAQGQVLEIGFGTGANLKYYDPPSIQSLTALDLKRGSGPDGPFPIHYVQGQAEDLPFEDNRFDTVVETLVLCSVMDLDKTISEIFRVLKPGGKFIFLDHVLPESPFMAKAFKGVNGLWKHLAGGCNLTRQPHLIIERQDVQFLESGTSANDIFRYGVVIK